MQIPFGFMKNPAGAAATWPFGTGGALTVLNGQTVDIFMNTTYDYSSIDVQLGGVLRINNVGNFNTCILGCSGNIIINGSVTQIRNFTTGGVYSNTDPLGNIFGYTVTQKNGGSGGTGGPWD